MNREIKENPLKEHYAKVNVAGPDNRPEFPYIVDVELTNHCNLKCVFCPGRKFSTRPKGHMTEETWLNILRQVRGTGAAIRFARWGEPTLHPKLKNYVEIAKIYGVITHVTTNGTFLHGLEKADSVKFSFTGFDSASYHKARGSLRFSEYVRNVEALYRKRDRPYIEVGTTIDKGEDASGFVETMERISDRVYVGRTVKFRSDNDLPRRETCHEVFGKLSVNWDGTVTACCSDYDKYTLVGNLKSQTLKEIWESDEINRYRDLVIKNKHRSIELCRDCYDYQNIEER